MKLLLPICFSLLFLTAAAQDKNAFYALDSSMNPVALEASKYLLWIHQKNDTNWQWDYYYTWGPLIKSYSYADHDGKVMNGRSSIYTIGWETWILQGNSTMEKGMEVSIG